MPPLFISVHSVLFPLLAITQMHATLPELMLTPVLAAGFFSTQQAGRHNAEAGQQPVCVRALPQRQ